MSDLVIGFFAGALLFAALSGGTEPERCAPVAPDPSDSYIPTERGLHFCHEECGREYLHLRRMLKTESERDALDALKCFSEIRTGQGTVIVKKH